MASSTTHEQLQREGEEHNRMCRAFDAELPSRAAIDEHLATTLRNIGLVSGLFNSLGESRETSAEVVRDCRIGEEIDLTRFQLAKLEDVSRQKERKLRQLQAELREVESGTSDCNLTRSGDQNPRHIRELLNSLLRKEEIIRTLEHRILHENTCITAIAEKLRADTDAADSILKKYAVLDAKREMLEQEAETLRRSILCHEQQASDFAQKSRVTFVDDQVGDAPQSARASLLHDIERLEAEIEHLKNGADCAGPQAVSRGRISLTGGAQPRVLHQPIESEVSATSPMRRRPSAHILSGQLRGYQQITEALALLKAVLFNLNTDLPFVTSIVDEITADPNHDDDAWRRSKVSSAFVDVIALMGQSYKNDAQIARDLLDAMRFLVVIWDLFESSLEEDIDVVLERTLVCHDAHLMFDAAQVCLEVVSNSPKGRSLQRRRSSVKSMKKK